MTNPIIKILDLATGEETEREMNADELAQYKADLKNQKAYQAEQAEKQALRESANAKLAALGLSPEEIAAITGA